MPSSIYPDEKLFLELSRSYVLCRDIAQQAIVTLQITLTEYNLLRIIQNNPRVTATEARERLMATAPSVTQVVQSLERKKLIRREQAATDARVQHLLLTPAGEKLIHKARSAINDSIQAIRVPRVLIGSLAGDLASFSAFLSPPIP